MCIRDRYPWVREGRDILIKYVKEEYGIDISEDVYKRQGGGNSTFGKRSALHFCGVLCQ